LGDAIDAYVKRSGLKRRLDQASVIPEWPELVGSRIASVTDPRVVLQGGILVVAVKSAAWMQELQMHSPEILRKLGERGKKISRIVWRAMD
jgi:predicted nucleic acid-binding Zn ribbon protein